MRSFAKFTGFAASFALAVFVAPQAEAQEEFQFAGVWVGEFEEETEPERDMAVRGGRERAIAGRDQYECKGTWTIQFRGPNENLRGEGVVEQDCRAAREGMREIPSQPIEIREIEFEDGGEGKEKKLKFEMRLVDVKTNDATVIRCETELEYKPDDDRIEGDYRCRQPLNMRVRDRSAFDQDDTQGTLALRIRGEFELTRQGTDSGAGR